MLQGGIALAARVGIERQGFFQVCRYAQIINHQTAGLVLINAVHAGDGLHQVMALHGLVDIERVQAWHIEARQPHIAHDDQFQLIVGVFHTLSQGPALFFGGVMLGDARSIRSGGGHHHLDSAFSQVVRMPFGAQFDDFIVQLGGNTTAHCHHHRLALKHLLAFLKMRHDVLGNNLYAVGTANQGLQLRPFRLGLLDVIHIFGFQLLVEVFHQLSAFIAQFHLGQSAFVEDAYCGSVFHRLGDVVNIDVIAKHSGCVLVVLFDWGTCEAEIGSVGQGIAQVFGKAVLDFRTNHFVGLVLHLHRLGLEAILGTVRLVGNHDDVTAVCKLVIHIARFGLEFLYRGENHATRLHRQESLQMLAALGLNWGLTQQLF